MTSSKPFQPNPFPLNSPKKFASLIGIPLDQLWDIMGQLQRIDPKARSLYEPFPRKTGSKERIIDNPKGLLKKAQDRINQRILSAYKFPDFIIGGVKGKDLMDHVSLHVNKRMVLTLDVKDCFPRITNKQVFRIWTDHFGAYPDTARLATILTSHIGHLPLGAPTSNALANLALLPCLLEVNAYITPYGFTLRQFVDDTALSGHQMPDDFIIKIREIFIKHGFKIKRKKICVMPNSKAQVITNRTVNQRVNVTREKIMRVRAAVHELRKMGKDHPEYLKKLCSVGGRIADIKKYNPSQAEKLGALLS